MTLGQKIRDCRVKQGMRRRELATRIGMSYEHVANIENGHTKGSPETLVLIAKALGVRVEKAMAGEWTCADDEQAPPEDQPQRQPNPTSHPEPTGPVPPPTPRRRNGASEVAVA